MDTNRYFSFSRLGLVMKRDLMENWKTRLYGFLGAFLVFLMMYILVMASEFHSLSSYISAHTSAFIVLSIFWFVYAAAEMMRDLRKKESRLSYLMLPATSLEKFVSCAIYVTVGLFLVILGASLLAEAVHWVFIPFFKDLPDEYKICVWPEVWKSIWGSINPFQTRIVYLNTSYETDPSAFQSVERSMFFIYLMGYMSSLWQHSIFVLGGNYFRKHPFIKTVAFMILVGSLIGWACTSLSLDDWRWVVDYIERLSDWLTEEVVAGFISFVFLAFTALNWWLSYKLFTRRQVIEPKFRLL